MYTPSTAVRLMETICDIRPWTWLASVVCWGELAERRSPEPWRPSEAALSMSCTADCSAESAACACACTSVRFWLTWVAFPRSARAWKISPTDCGASEALFTRSPLDRSASAAFIWFCKLSIDAKNWLPAAFKPLIMIASPYFLLDVQKGLSQLVHHADNPAACLIRAL